MRVALLITCVVDLLEPEVGEATARLLRASGCEVSFPAGQTCCGQPAWNRGLALEAAQVARATVRALAEELDEGAEAVIVPSGSCAGMTGRWCELFEMTSDRQSARLATDVAAATVELTSFLHGRSLPPLSLDPAVSVAYHASCHSSAPEHGEPPAISLLRSVEGCELTHWADAAACCGFGGAFSVTLPEISVAIADAKLASLPRPPPDAVVGIDSSCLVHLGQRAARTARPIRVLHLAELLAAGLDGRLP